MCVYVWNAMYVCKTVNQFTFKIIHSQCINYILDVLRSLAQIQFMIAEQYATFGVILRHPKFGGRWLIGWIDNYNVSVCDCVEIRNSAYRETSSGAG